MFKIRNASLLTTLLLAHCADVDDSQMAVAATAASLHDEPDSSAAPAPIRFSLPRPSGPYRVGVRFENVIDQTRIDSQTGQPRSLPVRVWYPARRSSQRGASAPYLAAAVQAELAQQLPALTGLVDLDTHAVADAPAHERIRAVILALPGGGALAAFQTGQVLDLASRGYAVLALDLPHESLVVEQPDGSLIADDDSLAFADWKLDAQRVLDEVQRLVPEWSAGMPIGAFGHSRGAAAVADLMDYDERIAAGVALDLGSLLFGDEHNAPARVASRGLDRPFALMCSLDQPCDAPVLTDFSSRLRGPHPMQTLEILHNGFNDFLLFNAQAAQSDAAAGASLEQIVPTGTADDPAAARRALRAQRRFLGDFFDQHCTLLQP